MNGKVQGVLFVVSLAACSEGGSSPSSRPPVTLTGTLSGSLFINDATQDVVVEEEPNGTLTEAQFLGKLNPGERRVIYGTIASSSQEMLDGFGFATWQRNRIYMSLRTDSDAVVLRVFDALSMQFISSYAAREGRIEAEFITRGATYVVVEALVSGVGDYLLEIRAQDPGRGHSLTEYPLGYYGELLHGEELSVTGILVPGGGAQQLLVVLPEAVRMQVDLGVEGGVAFDLDVLLRDATASLSAPQELIAFTDRDARQEGGSVTVPRRTLLQVVIKEPRRGSRPVADRHQDEPPPGEVPFRLSLTSRAPRSRFTIAEAPRLAAVEQEAQERLRRPPERQFGRVPHAAVRGEVIIQAQAGSRLDDLLARRGMQELESMPGSAARVGVSPPAALGAGDALRYTSSQLGSLRGHPDVEWCELNVLYSMHRVPDDRHYRRQWNLPAAGLPDAWDVTRGSDAVIVAILDTGSAPHPDLEGRYVGGHDFVGGDEDPTDEGLLQAFHGTHVMGIIGARTDNQGGVAGVTWNGRLMPVRVIGAAGATAFAISNGLLFAAGLANSSGRLPPQRADVVNMSFGGPGPSTLIQSAALRARVAGVVLVASAGNDSQELANYPAALRTVISVGATNRNGAAASYSTSHDTLALAAPGGDSLQGVLSTFGAVVGGTFQASYVELAGTSMAAPHVAGVAALMRSLDPELRPREIEEALYRTAVDLGAPGHDPVYGHGLLDAAGAVREALRTAGDPILSLASEEVILGPDNFLAVVGVTNTGTGQLQIDAFDVDSRSRRNWLTAEAVPIPQAVRATSQAVLVRAAGQRLPPGVHRGTVRVQSNGGSRSIAVTAVVGAPPRASEADALVWMILVDAATSRAVAEVPVRIRESTAFHLPDVPPGRYRLVAGSDDDGDQLVGGAGDLYFGELGGVVVIEPGSEATDLEWVVSWTQPGSARLGQARPRTRFD